MPEELVSSLSLPSDLNKINSLPDEKMLNYVNYTKVFTDCESSPVVVKPQDIGAQSSFNN